MYVSNMTYHLFWTTAEHKLGKKLTPSEQPLDPAVNYRKVDNSIQFKNTLKKYFGTKEAVDKAIAEDKLRVVLGTEINPSGMLGGK